MEFTPDVIAGLVLLGFVAGMLGGMLGLGGGVIQVPALTLIFGVTNPLFLKGIVFMAMLPTVISSTVKHYRSRLVLNGVVTRLVPLATAGVFAGYLLSRTMPIQAFKGLFGAFLLYVTAQNLYKFFRSGGEAETAWGEEDLKGREWGPWLLGAPMGLVAGVLGIGGGSLAGPAMQVLLSMPLKNAIACASVSMIPLVSVAIAMSLYDGLCGNYGCTCWIAVAVSALMTPGAVAGGWLGAWLTKILPVKWIRLVFALTVLATAVKLIQSVL